MHFQTTGHLLLTMPKLKVVTKAKKTVASPPTAAPTTNAKTESKSKSTELLGEGTQTTVDYRNIVKHSTDEPKVTPLGGPGYIRRQLPPQIEPSPGFVDDPDVPPLE
eukprot:TRINITY_DN4530_c0_g1_i5.p1 TRINITY_DN4530_c0_g1~~TRINITY_DN4530_c0_g1_i5.p1  ORF type:complete len:107 (+),score=21.83 TRINITY_DN4530_c0_g1_i5:52-372(+)